jgi:hypothetical protein
MPTSAEDRFNIEVIKLLLQVAWSDDQVDPKEAQMIIGLGRSWEVPELELAALQKRLEAGDPLPVPDLGLLRSRPDDVLEAARGLVAVDGKVGDEEKEMIEQIKEMLGAA